MKKKISKIKKEGKNDLLKSNEKKRLMTIKI